MQSTGMGVAVQIVVACCVAEASQIESTGGQGCSEAIEVVGGWPCRAGVLVVAGVKWQWWQWLVRNMSGEAGQSVSGAVLSRIYSTRCRRLAQARPAATGCQGLKVHSGLEGWLPY